jgi:hypothetical protein
MRANSGEFFSQYLDFDCRARLVKEEMSIRAGCSPVGIHARSTDGQAPSYLAFGRSQSASL